MFIVSNDYVCSYSAKTVKELIRHCLFFDKRPSKFTIKTNKILRDQAKAIAEKLGIPLTTIINAYLGEFIRERSFNLSLEPEPTKKKLRLWESISAQMDKAKKEPKFKDADSLLAHLKIG